MSVRPNDWWPLAESDPVPGDPASVRSVATHYGTIASSVQSAAANLLTIATASEDSSEAVAAFKERAGDVRNNLLKIESRYAGLSTALSTYAPALESAQADSFSALQSAQHAQADLTSARWAQQNAEDELRLATEDPSRSEDLQRQHRAAGERAETARDNLASARALLNQAVAARDLAATTAIQAIADTETTSAANDTLCDRIADGVGDVAVSLSAFLDTLSELLEPLSQALTILQLILLAATFVFPVFGLALAVVTAISKAITVITLVAGALKVLTAVAKVITGRQRMTWADVGREAAGYATKVVVQVLTKKFAGKVGSGVKDDVTGAGIVKLEAANRARGALWNENTFTDLKNIRRAGDLVGGTVEWSAEFLIDKAAEPLPDAVEQLVDSVTTEGGR